MNKKTFKIQLLGGLFGLLMMVSSVSHADLLEDFDSLGGNDVLLEQAKALIPETEVRVVQERVVSRRNRFEVTGGYSNYISGDTYLTTQSLDLGVQYHINPRISLGAHYFEGFNGMTSEGEAYGRTIAGITGSNGEPHIPDFDPIQNGYYGSVNFYPFYGKLNLLGRAVVHFDPYLMGGFGNVNLVSGTTDLTLYGAGVGFWLSQHLSTRIEFRQQSYEAQRYSGGQKLNLSVGSITLGYLL
jgi:outer membrane immunogenic protein